MKAENGVADRTKIRVRLKTPVIYGKIHMNMG